MLSFETLRFFSQVGFFDFVFGTHWSPQTAIREDQVGSSGSFGAIPLFTGDKSIEFDAGHGTEGLIYVKQPQALPMTILGIYPRLETENV